MSEYTILRKESFITTDLEKLFGINLLDPQSVRSFIQSMKSDKRAYARYLVLRLGYRDIEGDISKEVFPLIELLLDRYKQKEYLCGMENYEMESYQKCIA